MLSRKTWCILCMHNENRRKWDCGSTTSTRFSSLVLLTIINYFVAGNCSRCIWNHRQSQVFKYIKYHKFAGCERPNFVLIICKMYILNFFCKCAFKTDVFLLNVQQIASFTT